MLIRFAHLWVMVGLLAAVLLVSPAAQSSGKGLTDVQAKLVIIHSFISQYASWPGRYALEQSSEVRVCSTGYDEVTESLALLQQASTAALKVRVMRDVSGSQRAQCHVLYIASSQQSAASTIVAALKPYPVLTVSSVSGFVDKGGMVGLDVDVKRHGNFERHFVRYSINAGALSAARIGLQPDALEMAKKVMR